MGWLIAAAVLYYLYTQGTFSSLPVFGQRPVPVNTIDTPLPGGIVIGMPLPRGYRAYRLSDGSQVVIAPNASTAPGGWVLAMRNGQAVWFNERTGQIQAQIPAGAVFVD